MPKSVRRLPNSELWRNSMRSLFVAMCLIVIALIGSASPCSAQLQLPPPPPEPPSSHNGGSPDRPNRPRRPSSPSPAEIAARQRQEQSTATNQQGIAAYAKEDWATAEADFKKSLETGPNDPVVLRNLALTQDHEARDAYAKGDYATALRFFQQALANDPASDAENREGIRRNLAFVQENIEQRQKATTAAANMQQAIQSFAHTLVAAPSPDGLDFASGNASAPAAAAPHGDNSGLDFMSFAGANASPASGLKDAVADGPTTQGLFGTKVAKPNLIVAPSSSTVGTDVKAGDQLLSAAAAGKVDLTKHFDGGTAKGVGSFVYPSALGLSAFSEKARKDPEVISMVKELEALDAKRSRLEKEREELTQQRGATHDPVVMKQLNDQLTQKAKDYQDNLGAIFEKTQAVEKQKRKVDATVGESKATKDPQ